MPELPHPPNDAAPFRPNPAGERVAARASAPKNPNDRHQRRALVDGGHHADQDAVDFFLAERLKESAARAD